MEKKRDREEWEKKISNERERERKRVVGRRRKIMTERD